MNEKAATPQRKIRAVINLSLLLIGRMSPYPTEARVVIAQYHTLIKLYMCVNQNHIVPLYVTVLLLPLSEFEVSKEVNIVRRVPIVNEPSENIPKGCNEVTDCSDYDN